MEDEPRGAGELNDDDWDANSGSPPLERSSSSDSDPYRHIED